jgi:hypothetical protein
MNPKKIKAPIPAYSFVGIMYDKVKANMGNENKQSKKHANIITIREILYIVAQEWGVTEEDILFKSKKQIHVDARYTYFAALKLKYDMNLDMIGHAANKRHHTTVIHGLRCFYNRYHRIDSFRRIADNVFALLGLEYIGDKMTESLDKFENEKKRLSQ